MPNVAFHPERILRAADRAIFKNLSHAAAALRNYAIDSVHFTKEYTGWIMVRGKGGKYRRKRFYVASPPGTPVYGHKNKSFFKRAIRFDVLKSNVTGADVDAVIGPTASLLGDVMHLHEFGGTRYGHSYQPRPVMWPALEVNVDRFANRWQGSIGE